MSDCDLVEMADLDAENDDVMYDKRAEQVRLAQEQLNILTKPNMSRSELVDASV